MFNWKMTILSFIILLVASFYFPQVGSTVSWFLNHGQQLSLKLQRAAHQLEDVICNKPEECKLTLDEFFEFLNNIPQALWNAVANFLQRNPTSSLTEQTLNRDDETTRKQRRALLAAYNYRNEVIGNVNKAEDFIKSLRFSSYEESNLCDLKEGIPEVEFDATVEEIAELTKMPMKLKSVVKTATKFNRVNVLAVNKLHFRTRDGNMVFGRIAVLHKGNTLDMAYSLQFVSYALQKRQREPEIAANFTKFFETLDKVDNGELDKVDNGDSNGISSDLRQDFLAFFHKQAIKGFVNHCDYLIKKLDNGQEEEPEIVKQMTDSEGEKLEDVKVDGLK